ncbi:MAG: class II fumarate hydratase [Actinomycetota bacterium]|nr:class II fumarate hydratase [Actinomycetota bacterium]
MPAQSVPGPERHPERATGPRAVRVEHDSLGEVAVPVDAKWGAQTQRAIENFHISGEPVDAEVIRALAWIKGAAAAVNAELGLVDGEVASAVVEAAAEVAAGQWADEFPIDVFQTGSGTSTNMNVNEVLARLASERLGRPVHPNDEVNASQSSNDVFPSAVHLAAISTITVELLPALDLLAGTLRDKAVEFEEVVKAGRTHLMDATPVTLGQEFGGYAAAVEHGLERVRACLSRLGELALGGTAVGTGINAPPGFAAEVISRLTSGPGQDLPLTEARDHFEAQGGRDALVETSGALRTVAVSLVKVANDLRLMSSGPSAGLSEIRLPALQPGSSIMPGKVNPVIPEVVVQVAAQVMGNDAAIAFAGTTGTFELNVAVPLMARNLLDSIRLLAAACRALADRCVRGIEADVERCRRYAESSSAIATALAPHLGYEVTAEVVRTALSGGRTLREVVLERGLMKPDELDKALDVLAMTRGGRRV